MTSTRSTLAISIAATLAVAMLAACGGAVPTQAPGATSGGVGSETTASEATTATDIESTETTAGGGGNGTGAKPAGWDQYGKIHIEMSGPVTKSADYGFLPAGSVFGGDQGSALNFAVEGTNEIVSVLINPDGTVVVSYTGPDAQLPGSECTTSGWNVGAASGSGSFDCTAPVVIMGSGAMVQNGKIKGTFEAHA